MAHEQFDPENNPEHSAPNNFNAVFAELVGMGEVATDKPSIELQKGILADTNAIHRQQWADAGLLVRVIDEQPQDSTGGDISLLRRGIRNEAGLEVEQMYFLVQAEVQRSRGDRMIKTEYQLQPVAQKVLNMVAPIADSRFTQDDAELVFAQAARLDALKNEGILPDLMWDLSNISDRRMGMRAKPAGDL